MNKSDITRDYCMLKGPLARRGYDWGWHSFTGRHARTGVEKTFYIEYFLCNPALAQPERVIVWNDPERRKAGKRPPHGRAPKLKGRGLHLPLGVAVLQ